MAKRMWFTMKHHGWGWVPIKWEGWAVFAALFVAIYYITMNCTGGNSVIYLIMAVIIFLVIAYSKGPSPRWRWDKK